MILPPDWHLLTVTLLHHANLRKEPAGIKSAAQVAAAGRCREQWWSAEKILTELTIILVVQAMALNIGFAKSKHVFTFRL